MRAPINQALISKLGSRDLTVFDTAQPNLMLRLRGSGAHSYRVQLGRGRFLTLGRADVLTPTKARELARRALGAVADGEDPIAEKRKARAATLHDFLATQYREWAAAHLKTGTETVTRIHAAFPTLLTLPMSAITPFALERWRTQRHRAGATPSTTNRDLDALRSVLSKAVAWGALDVHPMHAVKRAKLDAVGRLRYLSPDEEKRLRAALDVRERSRRAGRERFNAWRAARGYATLPAFGTYSDHVAPITLLALNTGLRRGELLGLTWGDVDLPQARLTVRGASAKSGRTRHLPLNTEAASVLRAWKPADADDAAPVFPGPDGGVMFSLKTAWATVATAAKLEEFTFHDLRHTFASKLVQVGIDLNTVRELLGHADIKMTLRYSHLAPEHRAAAVAKLVPVW